MLYIINNSTDPWFNLALEEVLMKDKSINDDIVMLWQNDKSVIIGKHQNTVEEVNQQFADSNNIKIARRTTGGGAVYHDLGNLNYTFITNYYDKKNVDFKKFAIPVVKALQSLGLNPELSGRNDILLDGKKISGTAQACIGDRFMFHGTLLFDINIEMASKVLTVKADKIESKGIKSVKSRMTNIKPYLQGLNINDFKEKIISSFEQNSVDFIKRDMNQSEIDRVYELYNNKFSKSEWNYGYSPKCNFHKYTKQPCGGIDINLNIQNGYVTECKIFGDFIGIRDISDVENIIKNKMYSINTIREEIDKLNLDQYFGIITTEQLMDCIF
ncbi:lipoate-protein ligase A [Sedimentibacter acidaminivorans]|uniref:lipoate--protein ligase n=1 Tax=Sedimentibacter acidaminivorans TaxID=913099 RepID=A0ABS4GDY8_9FIRM|nr:lipoate--protein ligase [Sedimentibacter acidaminivorans]MBP1925906.1 lipoate-protein ligase A [Sedimentibacter acidaminivorans]